MFCVRQLFLLSLCFILKVITLNKKAGETPITHTRLRCIAPKLKIVDKYISDVLFLFPFSNYQTVRLNGQGTHKDKIRSFRWGMGHKGLGLGKVSAFLNSEWSLIFGAPLPGSPSLASVHIFWFHEKLRFLSKFSLHPSRIIALCRRSILTEICHGSVTYMPRTVRSRVLPILNIRHGCSTVTGFTNILLEGTCNTGRWNEHHAGPENQWPGTKALGTTIDCNEWLEKSWRRNGFKLSMRFHLSIILTITDWSQMLSCGSPAIRVDLCSDTNFSMAGITSLYSGSEGLFIKRNISMNVCAWESN